MAKKFLRQLCFKGNYAYVPLTRGYEAIIDLDDALIVQSFNWHVCFTGGTPYARCSKLRDAAGKRIKASLHRRIMRPAADQLVDHINGNGLDCRRMNMRLANHTQNARNCCIRDDNTSGFKGVGFHKASKLWVARISVNGKRIHLGCFATAKDAHDTYCDASKDYHKEFGRLK